jgi:hypothetical protein
MPVSAYDNGLRSICGATLMAPRTAYFLDPEPDDQMAIAALLRERGHNLSFVDEDVLLMQGNFYKICGTSARPERSDFRGTPGPIALLCQCASATNEQS